MTRTTRSLVFLWLSALAATSILSACSGDDGNQPEQLPAKVPFAGEMVMPDGWQGIWNMDIRLLDEVGGEPFTHTLWSDTLCAGDSLSLDFGPMLQDCTGYVRGDSLIFEVSDDWTEGPCTVTFTMALRAVRNGDLISGTGEMRLEMTGDCSAAQSIAGQSYLELHGMKTGDPPEGYCQ